MDDNLVPSYVESLEQEKQLRAMGVNIPVLRVSDMDKLLSQVTELQKQIQQIEENNKNKKNETSNNR